MLNKNSTLPDTARLKAILEDPDAILQIESPTEKDATGRGTEKAGTHQASSFCHGKGTAFGCYHLCGKHLPYT